MPTLVVIGGGAAGFFCAVNAARMSPGLKVVILEKSDKLLSKVRVSGGGRCNVTHACFDIEEMSNRYPRGKHFVRKAFHQFFTNDTIQWFGERGVELKAEPDGRMFPVTDTSSTVIECLVREANRYGVEIWLKADVIGVKQAEMEAGEPVHGRDATNHVTGESRDDIVRKRLSFDVILRTGKIIKAHFVCIATGGFPKPESYAWLTALGHNFVSPVPSLFTLNAPNHPITALMGVSLADVEIGFHGTKLRERGPILITHWGLSGPAVLRMSAWGARVLQEMNYTGDAIVNFVPAYNTESIRVSLQQQRHIRTQQAIGSKNPYNLPQRLWTFLLESSQADPSARWQELSSKSLNRLAEVICRFVLPVKGKTTFKEEFVTAGGIMTAEIEPQTMQSRKVPGLYFAGEILDVDGITGGYNFQHAWTSGFLAAKSIARMVNEQEEDRDS